MAKQERNLNHVYYEQYFAHRGPRSWMERIWRAVFGEEYPEGLENFGYVTWSDLRAMRDHLNLEKGDVLLDVGCGRGGPGLWVAREGEARLVGIDVVEAAVEFAGEFQAKFGLRYPARFAVGEWYEMPVEDGSVDAVMSVDALWTVPDKWKALMEVRRVLRPGGRFVFTHWDRVEVDPLDLYEKAGFGLVHRAPTPNWLERQIAVYSYLKGHREELVAEMGEAANMLLYEAEASPEYLDRSVRRVYALELRAD